MVVVGRADGSGTLKFFFILHNGSWSFTVFKFYLKEKNQRKSLLVLMIDDAEKFTSEMHDSCARSRCLQKITTQKHLTEGTGVEPGKYPPKVKSEIFLQL